jgi:hypothetical protein
MAITTESMLLKLSPMQGLDPVGAIQQAQQMSAQRQQMQLARERFEEEKRRAKEEKELREIEERGQMARAQMQQELQRAEKQAELEAAQQAALLAKQQEAIGKAGELAGTGKAQQLHAQSVLMDQLGIDQNYLGSVGGLPAYDFVNRAQAQAQEDQQFEQAPRAIDNWDGAESAVQSLNRLQGLGLGYPTNERGTLEDPGGADRPAVTGSVDEAIALEPGGGGVDEATGEALTPGDNDYVAGQDNDPDSPAPPIAEVSVGGRGMIPALLQPGDPFARALAASRAAEEAGGLPARAPDEEDYMGAVPRNRIDMAAMAAETMARLNPALQARVAALPPELQDAAKQNAAAIGGLGLEATDAIKEMDSAMEDPVSIYNSQQNLAAEKEKFQTQRGEVTPVQAEQLKGMGFGRGQDSYKNAKIGDAITSIEAGKTVKALMTGPKRNHEKAVNFLMQMTVNKGPQTEADALRVIGRGKLSSIDQLEAWLHERIVGGFEPEDIEAINEFVDLQTGRNRTAVFGWLANTDQQMRNPKTHERVRAGYEEFRNGGSIPPDLLDEYEALAKKADAENRKAAGQSAPTGDVGGELERQAKAAGFDVEAIRPLVGTESGGDPNSKNKMGSSASGLFQFTDETAKDYGLKDAAEYRALPAAKQIELGLKRFKDLGLDANSTADDFAMANAAPGYLKAKPGTVIEEYRSGTERGDEVRAKNPGWIPADGGEITNDSIRDFYRRSRERTPVKGAERKADAANPFANLPEPKTPEEKRVLELLKKRGG